MQKKKETIESEVLECLQEIEEFEEDDDYLCIEMYGGGPDESFLKGTKNALRLFALDILRKSCEIENESGIVGCFDPASEIRIDYIVASNNEGVYSKPLNHILRYFLKGRKRVGIASYRIFNRIYVVCLADNLFNISSNRVYNNIKEYFLVLNEKSIIKTCHC